MAKTEKPFTTKDIDKLKKALDKAGAKPLTIQEMEKMTFEDMGLSEEKLLKMEKIADNILETAEKLHRQCDKN